MRGVVTARVCVVMCTPGARRAATCLDWRGEKISSRKKRRASSTVVGGARSERRSMVCDSRFRPHRKIWGPRRPQRATRVRETPPPSRRRGGASVRAHRRARLPEAGIDCVTRRDVRRGPRVRLLLSRPSRPRLFCSAPRFVPRPVPYRPPVVPDLTIASPAHLRPTGASPALTASSMTSAARSPWAPSAAAR